MKVVEVRLKHDEDRSLKGFADVELDDGTLIRNMRIVQKQDDHRPFVTCPQTTWKDSNGQMRYSTIIVLPNSIKSKLDALILTKWMEAKESEHGNIVK